MLGSLSATLQGWATVAQNAQQWDHTYVISWCGTVGPWECGAPALGRSNSSGGKAITQGIGSSTIADCLSRPRGGLVYAGIIYGVTGVCHQMANRILHPAGQTTVAYARGYNVSVLLYNTYGRRPWPELIACYPPGTVFAPSSAGAPVPVPTGNVLSSNSVYTLTVLTAVAAQEATQVAEFVAIAEATLGTRLDQPTRENLIRIQAALQAEQARLAALLESREISSEQYLTDVNRILAQALRECQSLLGIERFTAIFGAAGFAPQGIIDPDAFYAGC